ncbi:hypothetical protein [Lampropedia aestuarii]|uniref:hypothetical protein n=1 Tax=Lampropedia aestuarii TaxID=2562762 RepID=UPI0024684A39|nr:hypothetical protein [Lampropedia aestuarii]MDH5858818.1 hypothetical protein [Lampropedia aestuarii]
MNTPENMPFPISGDSSPKPLKVTDIELTNVILYHFEQLKIHPKIEIADDPFPNIKKADKYARDSYDSLLQIKNQTNSLCYELIELGIYTEEQLKKQLTIPENSSLFERITTSRPTIERGIFRSFEFTKKYALKISRENIFIVGSLRDFIFEGNIPLSSDRYIFLTKKYFQLLRHTHENIGRMDALVFYFENNYTSKKSKKQGNKKNGNIEYQKDAKKIFLEMLKKQYDSQNKKFTTIASATKKTQKDFNREYEKLKITKKYESIQNFFDIKNFTRNITTWLRTDADFKESASKFINL